MNKPDIVVLDRESRRKCSIYPLVYREDIVFIKSTALEHRDFEGYLLLHVDGPPLTPEDRSPLLILDASWKWAHKICRHPRIAPLDRRSIDGFVTSYPRKSKLYDMPLNGLASVEALYIARLIQGREDPSLLNHYYWQQPFLEKNREQLEYWRRRVSSSP